MKLFEPVWEEAGPATERCAIVMAPMMAEWDQGAFCQPLTELLCTYGYRVTVYDTMSVARRCDDLPHAAARWSALLAWRHSRIDLVIGQAYGGALVQYMLDDILADCPRFLGISAPTYCDDSLRVGLDDVLRHLQGDGPESALQQLEWRVLADSNADCPPRPTSAPAETFSRLHSGLIHLRAADARRAVAGFSGHALWLYGKESRLVRANNIVPAPHRTRQRAVGLPRCGMRPFCDARHTAMALIEGFLKETTQ